MSQRDGIPVTDTRRSLVDRVAASPYISRSARLRDLLLYLTGRVLDGDVNEIHEQEVGHHVFGRPADYDTASDNIVRVHASTLRKRLEQYFASEGADEQIILQIPKGNYAPVFLERSPQDTAAPPAAAEPPPSRRADRRVWVLGAMSAIFGACTVYLLTVAPHPSPVSRPPAVQLFWSQIFQPGRTADIVLDDAAVALYQELSGAPLNLSNYFDRTYLRNLPAGDAETIVLRRYTSFAGANLLWKLFQFSGAGQLPAGIRFARDYSFRELRSNNAVLLGASRTNPWVEPFEARLGLRWIFDKTRGTYYPVDTWSGNRSYPAAETHEGYCSIALVPNLGGNGNVLMLAATGGSALNAGADFLGDEGAVRALRSKLPASKPGVFPAFEALVKVKGRGGLPRDAMPVICRSPK